MLEQLDIRDFALIDVVSIEFTDGFTVLSGETGAGKSILIGALSFVLGGKATAEQIRAGATEASVSATFRLDGSSAPVALAWLEEKGIDSEDGSVLLRRSLKASGKSGSWIQGVPVTRAELVSFSSLLIDIHGQHEHQSLMRVTEHRVFLDGWAGLSEDVKSFTKLYAELAEKRKILSDWEKNKASRERKAEMLSFAVKEIEDAKLSPNEDVELAEEENRLSSYEKLCKDMEVASDAIDAGIESGALSSLKKAMLSLSRAAEYDKSISTVSGRVENSFYEISDIAEEIKNYMRSLVFDPARFAAVQERLAVLNNLKKKYTLQTVKGLIAYAEKAKHELDSLTNETGNDNELQKQCRELSNKVYLAARAISSRRKAAADKMSISVEKVLSKLGMSGTKFCVIVSAKDGDDADQKCGPYGIDDVEFRISANPGSPPLPLAKIASGGELSRVMLAIKSLQAESDIVSTMIFDEIDTGIGGEVAVAVGDYIKKLALKRQILCITHLASIAVCADNQFKVEKTVCEGVTHTHVYHVSGEQRVAEIARMLSGDSGSEESLEHARSMLNKM